MDKERIPHPIPPLPEFPQGPKFIGRPQQGCDLPSVEEFLRREFPLLVHAAAPEVDLANDPKVKALIEAAEKRVLSEVKEKLKTK